MKLSKYSFGTGDRFGLQGSAQLKAVQMAEAAGTPVSIVWNKSHREHGIVGTTQKHVREEADQAVKKADWKGSYHVDADHINLGNVASFIDFSDFFTIDVADAIGTKADDAEIERVAGTFQRYSGALEIQGLSVPIRISADEIRAIAEKYLYSVQQAAEIYRHIACHKQPDSFITEVSMDETEQPQTPVELLFILAALAEYQVPLQTIAPKFSGRFNKGIDYQGDVQLFNREFNDDVCVVQRSIRDFGLPNNLKLSVHSGSDKFSIYPGIRKAIETHDCGIHVKTAGTTWLEELIGLAESGGSALELVKDIYRQAFSRYDELCRPYMAVIDIDRSSLPTPDLISTWDSARTAQAIRHDQANPHYDRNIRQLLHVGYKVAAELGDTYLGAVRKNHVVIGAHVCSNLFERHLKPLFL